MREQPQQQPPPVQRLRVRYAKRGRLRFTSHRDFSRAFERAVFRARVPMAYSSGFNPHPRISYAGAAPTGSASEAEYLEIALAEVIDPAQAHAALDEALPPGLDVIEVVPSAGGALADRLEASVWRIRLSRVRPDDLADAVRRFLATEEVLVERMTKKGMRTLDSRAAVVRLEARTEDRTVSDGPSGQARDAGADAGSAGSSEPCAILHMVLRHETPAVRPDDILAGLREIAGLDTADAPVQQRVAQGPLDLVAGTVGDPLAPDRDAVAHP